MRSILDSIGQFQTGGSAKGQPLNEQIQRPVDEGFSLKEALTVRSRLTQAGKPDAQTVKVVRENITRVTGATLTEQAAYELTEAVLRTHPPKDLGLLSDAQWAGFVRKPQLFQ